MEETILVTGGLGFIGRNIIRKLLKDTRHKIIILDKASYAGRTKKRVKTIIGDICKRRDTERAVSESSTILHLAADSHTFRSLKKPFDTVRTNVLGTDLLLEAAEKFNIKRFLFFSSSEVYGNKIDGIPMDEIHPLSPITPYAASKLAADRLVYSFFLSKSLPVIIFRPFNAYGPYQHPEKMIPFFTTKLIRDEPIILNHGGVQKRDWVFVDDIARAVYLAIKSPIEKVRGEVFNIGTGKATAIRDVAFIILNLLKKDKNMVRYSFNSKTETMGNVGISKKAKKILGWEPQIGLKAGIEKTVRWYLKNRKWWDRR